MKGDLGLAFEKLKESLYVKYRGALITKTGNYFMWNDNKYDDIDGAKGAVDRELTAIQKSIHISMTLVKEDGKEVDVGQEHTNKYFNGKSAYESYKKQNP